MRRPARVLALPRPPTPPLSDVVGLREQERAEQARMTALAPAYRNSGAGWTP